MNAQVCSSATLLTLGRSKCLLTLRSIFILILSLFSFMRGVVIRMLAHMLILLGVLLLMGWISCANVSTAYMRFIQGRKILHV